MANALYVLAPKGYQVLFKARGLAKIERINDYL